jgi:hypothetical protein
MSLIMLTQVTWEDTKISQTPYDSPQNLAKNFRIKTVSSNELKIIDRFSILDKEFCYIGGKWD